MKDSMPDLETLPRQQISITIQGYSFSLIAPYIDGQVINDIEAGVLNREWTNGVRANIADKIKEEIRSLGDSISNTDIQRLQLELQHYADDYSFKALIQNRNSDPIVREAYKIAKTALDTKLNAKGISKQQFGDAKYEQTISSLMNNPQVVAQATERVKLTRDTANALIDLES